MGLGTCHPDPLPWCSVEGCAWHVHIYLARSLDDYFSHVAVVLLHISHVVVAVVDAELDTAACANRPSCHVLATRVVDAAAVADAACSAAVAPTGPHAASFPAAATAVK